MSIRTVRGYAVAKGCKQVLYLASAGGGRVAKSWDPSIIVPATDGTPESVTAQNAAVAAMLGVPELQGHVYGDTVNEGLSGAAAANPLSAVANDPSNPLGLDADLVGKYAVTADDVAVAKYVAFNGAALWDHLATLAGGPPGASGAGFDDAKKASEAAAAQHQEELYAWDVAHPDQAPQSERGKAEAGQVLKLLGGRFEVRIPHWEEPAGRSGRKGAGQAVTMFPGVGWFWFFGPQIPEVFVTVLDNGAAGHSVKLNASTDAGFTVVVKDTVSGKSWQHVNTAGNLMGVIAWLAFPG